MFDSVSAGSSARRNLIWLAVVLLVIGAGYWWYQAGESSRSAKGSPGGKTPPVPVKVETAKVQDLDIFLRGLGTVTAYATVTILVLGILMFMILRVLVHSVLERA